MLIRAATLLLLSVLVAAALAFSAQLSAKATWVVGGLCSVCVGCILFCEADNTRNGALRYAAVTALLLSGLTTLALMIVTQRIPSWLVPAGLFALTFFMCAVVRTANALSPKLRTTPYLVFGILLTAAVPVSFGPLLEQSYDAPDITNAVIALSPASYLASLVEFDYLRSEWFYQNTPYGAMRYEYANPVRSSILLLCVGAAFGWAADAFTARRRTESITLNDTPMEDSGL